MGLVYFSRQGIMSQHDKYIREKQVLEAFRTKYSDFPSGKIIKSESPDFIIRTSKKRSVGIELTQITSENLSAPFFHKTLEETISRKDEKLVIYKKKMLDKYWLIIYSSLIQHKIPNNMLNKMDKHGFISSFNKLFLFDLAISKIWVM